jgi:cytochrome c-type biogenesis protein CcmH/NrfF
MEAASRMRVAFVLLAVALAGAAGAAHAEESEWAYELSDELMSPFCPGRALSECPSPQAEELRLWIIDQERAGVPREQVEAELYGVWGDQLRQAPRAEGVGLVAYLVPAGVFLAGGGLVAWFLRRQRRDAGGPADETPAVPARVAPGAPGLDAELEREVDEELGRA